jgi:hypothetical protein
MSISAEEKNITSEKQQSSLPEKDFQVDAHRQTAYPA